MAEVGKGIPYKLPRFVLGISLGTVLIGGVIFVGSQYRYLILGYAVLIGFAAGLLAYLGVHAGVYSNRLLVVLVAMMIGFGMYSTFRAMTYLYFQHRVIDELVSRHKITPESAKERLDKAIRAQTGSSGLIGYIKYNAQHGITIATRSRSLELELNERQTYMAWLVELLIVTALPGIVSTWPMRRKRSGARKD